MPLRDQSVSAADVSAHPGKILLRVLVTFHGAKIILLLDGYDKGKDRTAIGVFDAAYAKLAVGAALATARKARHLDETELAGRTGMSQGDISKIERGVVAPTTPTLLKLVHALGAELTLTVPSDAATDSVAEPEADVRTKAESLSLVMA